MLLPVLYVLAALWFLGNQLMAWRRAQQSAGWTAVKGTIQYAQRELFAMDDFGNLVGFRIRYEYRVGKETLIGRAVSFSPRFGRARRMLQTLKPGKRVQVYVNPSQPTQAVLEPGIKPINHVMVLTGVVLLALTAVNLLVQTGTI